ncbi:MAG: zinc metalloprotease [Candidatus Hecatellaceae archaeon]
MKGAAAYYESVWYTPSRRFTTSTRELTHLAIALVTLIALGFSWFGFRFSPPIIGAVLVGVLPAFLLHEFAHKFSAQKYGFWAEFRLDPFGIAITAFSILAPFKIIAPGAVLVWGPMVDRSVMGRISLAGPLTNMLLVAVFFALSPFMQSYIVWFGVSFNAFVAFFNLLPFGIFDGRKVLAWNWKVWLIFFAASLILLARGYI